MKQIATEAIVLSRLDFGEASRILTMLTKDQGKISVLAKGVRKPKSKLAGGVELFTSTNIVFFDGKSEIKTLVSAQLKKNYSEINSDITRSMTAYDVLKYTNKLTESVCEDEYFGLVTAAFKALNGDAMQPSVVWIWFGVRLLEISGHAINTSTDTNDEPLKAGDKFGYDYNNMAFVPHATGHYSAAHIKLLRLCQENELQKIAMVSGVGKVAEDMKKLIADSINYSN